MSTDDTASTPQADERAINRLLEILAEDDESVSPGRAYAAAHALTQLGEPGIAALALVVRDWGAYGVWALEAIIQALGESGDMRAAGLLRDIIRKPPRGGLMGEEFRAAAALARLGAPGSDALADVVQSREMSPETRWAAASIIGDTGDETTDIAPLLAALDDRHDPLTAAAAASSLGKLHAAEAIPALIALLSEESRDLQFLANSAQGALFTMGAMAFPALVQALSAPSAVARQHAAWALCWQAADARARDGLLVALDDEDAEVRAAVLCALRDHGGPDAIPMLERIRENDEGVSTELGFLSDFAGEAIRAIETRAASPEGHTADEGEDETEPLDDAAHTASALAQLGPKGLAALAEIARDSSRDSDVRVAAVDALASTGDEEAALAPLLDVLHDPTDSWLAHRAAYALGALGSPAAIPDLIQALDSRDPFSAGAEHALVQIGKASVSALAAEVTNRERSEARRRSAAQALRELASEPAAADALFVALSDPDPVVRRLAVEGIAFPDNEWQESFESSEHLRDDPQIVRALLPLLDDPDERVRAEARRGLRVVGGPDDAALLERAARFATSIDDGATIITGAPSDTRAEMAACLRLLAREAGFGNDWRVIWRAARTLGRLGDYGLAALDAALHDANLYARLSRIWAIDALGASGDARAIPPLLDALRGVIPSTPEDGRFAEELRAAAALARLGPQGRAMLEKWAQEADAPERTRWAAGQILADPPAFSE